MARDSGRWCVQKRTQPTNFVEQEVQPDLFGSIPKAMWWGAVTLTTVGYGDVYPITTLGRFLSAFILVLGIGSAPSQPPPFSESENGGGF